MGFRRFATVRGAIFVVMLCSGASWSAGTIGGDAEGSLPGADAGLPDLSISAPLPSDLNVDNADLNQAASLPEAAMPQTERETIAAPAEARTLSVTQQAEGSSTVGSAADSTQNAEQVAPQAGTQKEQPVVSAQAQASHLADAVAPQNGENQGDSSQAQALEEGFENNTQTPNEEPAVIDPDVAQRLRQFYPRAVFIEDGFKGPASERTVASVEKLLDAGVHVVFMTYRPLKGEDSAESILISRLKNRQRNPIMIASYGGAKITFAGRAENPKSIIEDEPGFHEKALTTIRAAVERLVGTSPNSPPLREELLPEPKQPLAYALEVPADVPSGESVAKEAASSLNRSLAASGLDYRFRVSVGNPRRIVAFAMPLSSSLLRIERVLSERFADENLLQEPHKFLVLAAPGTKSRLGARFPAGADIQVFKDQADLDVLLGAVLSQKPGELPSVTVKLAKLRQFVEFWEPKNRLRSSDEKDGGEVPSPGGGALASGPSSKMDGDFGRYMGSVISQMMAYLYERIRKNEHSLANRPAIMEKLNQMWYHPIENRVFVDPDLLKVMHGDQWRGGQRRWLDSARDYLESYYERAFGKDFSVAAADIRRHLKRLKTDFDSTVALDFRSPATGRDYKVYLRVPRVMWRDTSKGRILEAHAYKTGKEPVGNEKDLFYAQMLARALLKGDGRMGPDGKWHQDATDGPVIDELRVIIHYKAGAKDWTFKPEDFLYTKDGSMVQGPIAAQITSAIEREEADEDFQADYGDKDKEVSREQWKAAAQKARLTAKAQVKAKSEKKTKRK